jgi:hypothetical protein
VTDEPEGVWVDGALVMTEDVAGRKVAEITILCPMDDADDEGAWALADLVEVLAALALQPPPGVDGPFGVPGRVTDARLRAMTLDDLAALTPARATPR